MEQSAAMQNLKERAKPHAASTLPGHALCRLYPAVCLYRLYGPKRVCVQLVCRTYRLTTQETTRFSIDATPVKIPIVQAEKGVDVHCSLDPSDVISLGMLKQQKVDVLCRYPDDQMITARALTIFDIFTGDTLTHPVMLFFSNVRKYNETLYRLYVDCQ
jgi:hypothetical protein